MPETLLCEFMVAGVAQPAGSKRAMPIYRKGAGGQKELARRGSGAPMIAVVDANPKSKAWKGEVAQVAYYAMAKTESTIATGPLRVEFIFHRVRPAGHFGSGKNSAIVKASAPAWPTTKPDLLKCSRGVEDAMKGIVYADDSQIVLESLEKRWGETACCVVKVWSLSP